MDFKLVIDNFNIQGQWCTANRTIQYNNCVDRRPGCCAQWHGKRNAPKMTNQ